LTHHRRRVGGGVPVRAQRPRVSPEAAEPQRFQVGRGIAAGGTLEHLGRVDSQVRAFRIELDEIRSVLLEHPA
jgi:non-ribosomal peptide synthetase component F